MGFATSDPDTSGETNDSSTSSTSTSFDYEEDEPEFTTTTTTSSTTSSTSTSTDSSTSSTTTEDDSDMTTSINTTATDNTTDNRVAAYFDVMTSASGNADEQLLGGTTTSDILGNATANMDVMRQFAQDVAQESTPSMPDLENAQERAQELVVQVTGAGQGTSRLVVIAAAAVAGVVALGSLIGIASEA